MKLEVGGGVVPGVGGNKGAGLMEVIQQKLKGVGSFHRKSLKM